MELLAKDFHFYTDGQYRNVSKWDSNLQCFDNDLKTDGSSIRIFGTQKQIDKALDDFCKITGLNLDEAFDYKVEAKGSYWHRVLDISEEQNEAVRDQLNEYKKLYDQTNKKVLILNLIK